VGFFAMAVCLVGFSLLLRSVRADVTEALWQVGEELMEYPGATHERVRQLNLNGAPFSFRTQTVDAPLADVLAHYQALCAIHDAQLANQLTSPLETHPSSPSSPGPFRGLTTQTARNGNGGYVACLDMGGAPKDLGVLADAFLRFSRTGDLREVGGPRYVFARRVPSSVGDRTFLLTMWTDSAVNLYQMLPRGGLDASGHDPVGVPRPPGSQRILSAREALQPSGVFVYRVVDTSTEALESFYRNELSGTGWTIIERNPSESVTVDGVRMISAGRENRLVTVLSHSGEGPHTVLTILTSEPS